MILDDKKRVIGKIVVIHSDKFTVELLSGTKNFNVNGYDDIHNFAQINSYVIVPYQNSYIVAEVVSVREKDSSDFYSAKEQELSKAHSVKILDVLPVGIIENKKFTFGVSVYPTLYTDVLYVKDEELDAIFEVTQYEKGICLDCVGKSNKCSEHKNLSTDKTRLLALDVGRSAVFPDYDIKVDIDKFFGSHSAVLGNTGSGKSCTIASMVQTLYAKENNSAVGSTFVFFDVNGEYANAFSGISNTSISYKHFRLNSEDEKDNFLLPHYYLNVDEWALLLNASEKTQLPILRNALGLATLLTKNTTEVEKVRNHVIASCVLEAYSVGESSVAKYQRIHSLLRKGTFPEDISAGYSQQYGSFSSTTAEQLFISKIKGYLVSDNFEIPEFDNSKFEFNKLDDYLDIAILYEESHGNKQIRDYCSSLLTRYKSVKERADFSFIKESTSDPKSLDLFLATILGVKADKKDKQIIIIDLNSAEDETVELVSSVLTRLIFNRLRKVKDQDRNTFPVNLVLEEAHRYISHESKSKFSSANQIFERVAKEGRKYGLFFLISSQRPSELSRTVLSQCNNFIVHRIQNPDDLSHIRQITPHISEATLKKLPSIPTQHALIFGHSVNIPTLYKVKTASPLPLSDNNKVSENWFIEASQPIAIFKTK